MNKPKFVTCNFTQPNLYGSRMCGRLNRDQVYMYSLAGVANVSPDIIVNYTSEYNRIFVDPFLESKNINNIEHINYDLINNPFHNTIEKIKDIKPQYYTDPSWISRNCEIMTGKFFWLNEQLKSIDNDDTLYWIDAGLSQGSLINRKFNTFHNNKLFYREDNPNEMMLEYAHRHDIIFNSNFSKKLDHYADGKIFLIVSNHAQHNDELGFDFLNILGKWPIGGLFGGPKYLMQKFIDRFFELYKKSMDNNCLVKEEATMAVIYNENPEWFKVANFEQSYHSDWGDCYKPELKSFCDIFDKDLKVG